MATKTFDFEEILIFRISSDAEIGINYSISLNISHDLFLIQKQW